MPPPSAGSRATDSDGNGNGPKRLASSVIARVELGHERVALSRGRRAERAASRR